MTTPTSLLPQLLGEFLPPANPAAGLSDDERGLVQGLSSKLVYQSTYMRLSQQYYDGTQRLADLGVSIPPQLAGVRTVVDWPRICIDPLVQRATVDGFRLPGQTDTDSELWEFWQANNLDSEFALCMLDSLALGRGYIVVGAGDRPGDAPIITVESPFNLAMNWDPRSRSVSAAYQAFEAEGVFVATLYTPDVTVYMSRTASGEWQVDHRDEHGFGEVPVVRFANRMRSADREGRSEITPSIRNITDSTCRSLLGMEIAREFYSVPHRYILGATESDYVDSAGAPKTALDMVMSKFLAFERDEQGNKPEVGQFNAYDPTVYTKAVDMGGRLMASYTGFPPEYFGLVSQANPASADAIRANQDGMNRRGRQVQNQASDPAERVMCLSWRFAHNGAALPDVMRQMETDWTPVETPTPSATADAMLKMAQMGAVTPTSDVILQRLGFSAVERARLAKDRENDAARSELAELANSLLAKEARTDKAVITDITTLNQPTPGMPGNKPATPPPGAAQ